MGLSHTCPQDESGLCDDCPCHKEGKNILKDISPEKLAELEENGAVITRIEEEKPKGYGVLEKVLEDSHPRILQAVKHLFEEAIEATKEEVLAKAEEYKVPKEATKINKTGADYIFIYDLKKFVLSTNPKEEK